MTEKYQFSDAQRSFMEHMTIPFAVYQFLNRRVVTLILSDGFCDLFGYEDKRLAYYHMDNDMYLDTHPDDVARIADAAFRFATEDARYEVVYRTKTPDRSGYQLIHAVGEHVVTDTGVRLAYVWYMNEGLYTEEAGPQTHRLTGLFSNVLHEESLIKASHYDYMTGLPSMAYFFELAEADKQTALQNEEHPALLFLDLSGMKFYNTTYGFAEGDKLLLAFARLLSRIFSNENCCRIAADHFAVYTREEGLEETLERLFLECKDLNGGNALPVRVGIYLNRTEDVSVSTACDRAKLACDSIRNSFVSGFHYFNQSLRDDMERRQYILSNLDRALEEGWIRVCYHAIVRAVNGLVCDEEALARWADPVRGTLPPADFIPFLEDAGLIYKLDLYVVDQVLKKSDVRRSSD